MHRIDVNNIKCYAYHGCLPSETKIGTHYVVKVSAFGDFSEACIGDDLSKTVDYCVVSDIVVEEMKQASKLIEHVAHRILNALKKAYNDAEFEVCITKLSPPIMQDVGNVSFTMSSK